LKLVENTPHPFYSYDIASSQIARRLLHICKSKSFHAGLFWQNNQGVVTLAGAIVNDPSDDAQVRMWSFVAASSVCTFEPLRGSPGRALAKGSDWMSDVQALDETSFPRISVATAAGLHTSCAVSVHGGVAEFVSKTCLPDESQRDVLDFISQHFSSQHTS